MSRLLSFSFVCLFTISGLVPAVPLQAQLPATRLGSVVPLSGNPGKSLEVTIAGDNLDEVTRLIFSHAGITAQQKMLEPGPFDKGPVPAANQFEVTIAGNVPAGRYEVRAEGKYGVSNSRTFFVSPVTQAAETEPNATAEEATELQLPADVSGSLQATADVDYFRFTAAAAQRVILDCYARRADSAADLVVTAYDSAGREIASSRDAQRHDPLLDFQAAAGGTYTLKLNDSAYRGGADYLYRFTVGALPHLDYLYPPAAEAGGNRSFTVYGRNLPGGQNAGLLIDGRPLEKLPVTITLPAGPQTASGMFLEPASVGIDSVAFSLQNSAGPSNVIMAAAASAPPVLEQEPNNSPAQPQALTVPCEVMGQFLGRRDHDWYTFQAQAGEQLAIEVISARLGLGTDPNLLIERVDPPAEGESEPKLSQVAYLSESEVPDSGPEFFTHSGDVQHLLTVDTAGTYRILLRDRRNALKDDPRQVYRLAIRRAKPDFRLAAVPVGSYSSLLLRKGGRLGIRVVAFREDGFEGEIEVTVSSLPAGVTCENAVIGPSRSAATLTLVAASGAAGGSTQISITGKSQIAGAAVERKARLATATQPLAAMQNNNPPPPSPSRLAEEIVLSVSPDEVNPTALSAGGGQVWETSRAGILKIPYARAGSFTGKFTLNPSDLPENIDRPVLTINPNQNAGEYELKLKSNTPEGTYTFHFAGIAEQVDYTRNPEAAASAAARQKEVEAIVAEQTAAAKTAADAKAVADKALADAMAQRQQASSQQQLATAALSQAAAALADAKVKLAEAQQNSAAQADDASLKAAVAAAEKVVADQEAKHKEAVATLATAEKAQADLQLVVEKAMAEQLKATEAAEQAAEMQKLATELKVETDNRAKQAADAAKPQKLNVPVVSSPVTIKITPAPVDLQPLAASYTVKQGEKLEVPISLVRKYGFTPAVNLSVRAPQGVAGISIPNAQVAASQAAGKLEIAAAANATPGQHTFIFVATMNLNNQNLTLEQPLTLTVQEVTPVEQ